MTKEKYVELHALHQQLEKLQEQLQRIEGQLTEMKELVQSLGEVSGVNEQSEFLAPIANGIFVKGKLLDNKSFYVNVGEGVVVSKTVSETKKLIEVQIEQLTQAQDAVLAHFYGLIEKAQDLQAELNKSS